MDDRAAVAWIHRRVGLGLAPDELEAARGRGVDAELAALFGAATVADDPWGGTDVPADTKTSAKDRASVVAAWIGHLCTTTTPLIDRVAWLLHGWLASSMEKVRSPAQMVGQIRLFRDAGLGPYPELLRRVTTDPAMLVYLDGRDSTGHAPNENYGRELLELFSLGVGQYTEGDVKAGARALTGWTVGDADQLPAFRPRRHDDTPQAFLGAAGVHDVDSMIAAVAAHPAHPRFVATRVAREVLGTADDAIVDTLAATYLAGGHRLDAVLDRAVVLGLAGSSAPVVLAPVPWLVMARRATGTTLSTTVMARGLLAAGQVPMFPPNVAGWPSGAWFASSTVVARANLAAAIAEATARHHPLMRAAANRDLDTLAEGLGIPAGSFGPATTSALQQERDDRRRLALALVSPEYVIA